MNSLDKKILNILYKEIDVNDENIQEKYFQHLDHLIDAIIKIRFRKYKSKFKY